MIKKCNICGRKKSFHEFNKNHNGEFGLDSTCRECRNSRSRNYRKNNPLLSKWKGIKRRCFYPKDKDYPNYGSRGISMCDEWRYNFKSFDTWCRNNGWSEECNLEIDRIDNDGNYEPSNCRFVSKRKNSLNRRPAKNKSGYTGIWIYRNKWMANIRINYKRIYLGIYPTIEEALTARNKYILDNGLEGDYPLQEI